MVPLRPCVSISPATTSTPALRLALAATSISQVLPTPGAAPRKIFRYPRWPRSAWASNASGSGLASGPLGAMEPIHKKFGGAAPPRSVRIGCDAHALLWGRGSTLRKLLRPGKMIQGDVELQHVHMVLADDAVEVGMVRHLLHQPDHGVRRQVPGGGDGRRLAHRVVQRDVGVETRPRGGDGISRHRPRTERLGVGGDALLDGSLQSGTGR